MLVNTNRESVPGVAFRYSLPLMALGPLSYMSGMTTPWYVYIYLSIYLSISLSIYLSLYLSIYLYLLYKFLGRRVNSKRERYREMCFICWLGGRERKGKRKRKGREEEKKPYSIFISAPSFIHSNFFFFQ